MCSPQEEVLVEDSSEAEGVVPTDSQDGEASQVGQSPNINNEWHSIFLNITFAFPVNHIVS